MTNKSYLLKLYYRKKNQKEYSTFEMLLNGNDKNIMNNINYQIKMFDDTNKTTGYKVEAVELFEHKKSINLKDF